MAKAASLRNLRPWKPGQSGNPNGRPKAPRFTERDQQAILTALAGALGEGAQRDAIKAMQTVLTNPGTILKALELCARLNGELDSPHRVSPLKRPRHQGRVARSTGVLSRSAGARRSPWRPARRRDDGGAPSHHQGPVGPAALRNRPPGRRPPPLRDRP
jgi:Family of unknown function (DUF5681)